MDKTMNKMKQDIKNKTKGNSDGLLSPLGCGFMFFVVCVIIMTITIKVKRCNEKKPYENEPWYVERQNKNQKYADSIQKLNELAKSNPNEYNRIVLQEKMWKYIPESQTDNVSASIKSIYDGYMHLPEPVKHKNRAPRTKNLGKSTITIRHTNANGNEVSIMIPNISQHSNSNKQYILADFDNNGNSIKYNYHLSGNNIILDNSKNFIERCKEATHISFTIPVIIYTESQTDDVKFEFEVPTPLVWKY